MTYFIWSKRSPHHIIPAFPRLWEPLDEQDTSYLAASARIPNFSCNDIPSCINIFLQFSSSFVIPRHLYIEHVFVFLCYQHITVPFILQVIFRTFVLLYFLYYTLAWKKVCLLSAIAFSSLDILIYFIKLVSVLCPVICMIDKLGIPAL